MALVEITEAKRQFVGGVNYNLGLVMKGENGRVACSVSLFYTLDLCTVY